jgi:uncharacterized protein YecE (DUF72 family)
MPAAAHDPHDLFGEVTRGTPGRRGRGIEPAEVANELVTLAARLDARHGARLHLGTSSWHFPGWAGLVWAASHPEATLSRQGLAAYACHPLLRTVSLDRAFYRPLKAATYRALAAQTGSDFRFVVKAPAAVTDATLRESGSGRAIDANVLFLDPRAAVEMAAQPAAEGLGERLGALVFQISPLPRRWLDDTAALHARLDALFAAVVPELPPGALAALEVRDAALLTPALAALLKGRGVRYCLGLHDRLPSADEQLPMLRATWPGDLVCRWNLQRGQRYADARDRWAPFDRLQAPDPGTRATLARVLHGTLAAGHRAFVTINNKAEGSAPHSVFELARALDALDTRVG